MSAKLTANAQAVLDAVRSTRDHPTANEIYEIVRQVRPNIGLASVYRILHSLVAMGCIKELQHTDESRRYDGHVERHDHAICTECGSLLDLPVEISIPEGDLHAAAATIGVELCSHEIRLYGRCAECNARAANAASIR